jgi:hypothetical protein
MPLDISLPNQFRQELADRALQLGLERYGAASVTEVSEDNIRVDMGNIEWIDLGALLWLFPLLSRLKSQANEIRIVLPRLDPTLEPLAPTAAETWKKSEGDRLRRVVSFLIRWRFFEALRTCVDEPFNLLDESQSHLLTSTGQYSYPKSVEVGGAEETLHGTRLLELSPIVYPPGRAPRADDPVEQFLARYHDRVAIGALRAACGWTSQESLDFIELVLGEGLRNAVFHSQGSFSLAGMHVGPRSLVLAVADNGRGIPSVLRTALSQLKSRSRIAQATDSSLIEYFTQPEMILDSHLIAVSTQASTTSDSDRAGMGLFYMKGQVLKREGRLSVRSGRARVSFSGSSTKRQDGLAFCPGTTLRVELPVKGN